VNKIKQKCSQKKQPLIQKTGNNYQNNKIWTTPVFKKNFKKTESQANPTIPVGHSARADSTIGFNPLNNFNLNGKEDSSTRIS